MILKKIIPIVFSFVCLLKPTYGSFEYSGEFLKSRSHDEEHSYYILLKENNNVTFSFKSNGNLTNDVYVKRIALSSDMKILKESSEGITSFNVDETSIYIVSVATKLDNANEISYDLTVEEKEKITSDKISAQQNQNETLQKVEPVEAAIVVEPSKVENDDGVKESNHDAQKDETVALFTSNEEIIDEIGPDSVAVSDEPLNNQIATQTIDKKDIIARKLNLSGQLSLIKSFNFFSFMSEKNKCWPKSISFDSKDNIWILDGQLKKLICFDYDGNELKTVDFFDKSIINLPVSIYIHGDNILVGDRTNHCIQVFDSDGIKINTINSNPSIGLKIVNPISICFRKNEIWVGDSGTNRILCFDNDYKFLGSFGSTDENKIDSVVAITSDNESIFVLDEEGIVKKFGPMGNFELAFPTGFTYPTAIVTDNENNLWVSDSDSGSINCYNKEGNTLFEIKKDDVLKIDSESSKFSPAFVAISKNNAIVTADNNTKQIKIFELK